MYKPTPEVPAEVWINGALTKATLAPYITEFGFSLMNQSGLGGWGGPHFDIRLLPPALAEMLAGAKSGRAALTMEGKGIGHVDEVRGRPAADEGPYRRQLARVEVEVRRQPPSTRFSFEGSTWALDLMWYRGVQTLSAKQRAFWTFRLWFLIDDDKLGLHFHDKIARQAMEAFVGTPESPGGGRAADPR